MFVCHEMVVVVVVHIHVFFFFFFFFVLALCSQALRKVCIKVVYASGDGAGGSMEGARD